MATRLSKRNGKRPCLGSMHPYLLIAILLAVSSQAQTLSGRVVKVTDGDTITIFADRAQHKVRLGEIDAPERGQPFGNKARQALAGLVANQIVDVEVTDTDRYGRLIGQISVDGTDVNRKMVANGFAWVYRQYLTDQSLLEDEARAREARVGLWTASHPIPPWEWRRGTRQSDSRPEPRTSHDGCGRMRTCGEMLSCAQAKRYLRECGGLTRLDRDGDGVPCERLCRFEPLVGEQ